MRNLVAVILCWPTVLGRRGEEEETNLNIYVGQSTRNVNMVTGEAARTLLAEANSKYPHGMFTVVPDMKGAEKYMTKALPHLLQYYFGSGGATTFDWMLLKVAAEHGAVKFTINWKATEKTFSEEQVSKQDVAFPVSTFPLLLRVSWEDIPMNDVKNMMSPPENLYMLWRDRGGTSFLAGSNYTKVHAKIQIQKWVATFFGCDDIPMRFEIEGIDSSERQNGVAYAIKFVDKMRIITQDALNTQLMQTNQAPEKFEIVTVKVTRNFWLRTPWLGVPQHCPYGNNMGHFNVIVNYSENQKMFLHYHCELQTWYGGEGQRWCETSGKGTVVLTGSDSPVNVERLPIPTAPGKKMKDWKCTFFSVPDQWGDEESPNVVKLGSVSRESNQIYQPSTLHNTFFGWAAYSATDIN